MARGTSFVAQGFCWLATTTAAVGLLMHFFPARQPLTIGLAAAAPLLMPAAGIALLGFAVLRAVVGLVATSAVTVACVAAQAPLFVADPVAGHGTPLVVMQTNIELGKGDPERLAELVARHDVDIMAVNELTVEAAVAIAETGVADHFPYSYLQPGPLAYGTGVWSRYPISSPRRLEGFTLASLEMTIEPPDAESLRFFAFHPVYPLDPAGWFDELSRIRDVLADVPEDVPVLAAGDYNATTDHTAYRRLLSDGYGDAGELAGAGWLPTYPADRIAGPLFAIDHVVVRRFDASEVRTESVPGADHRAVVAELRPVGPIGSAGD